MKKLMMISALAFGMMTACSQVEIDNATPSNPEEELTTVYLRSTIDEATRSQWIDGEGISWEVEKDGNQLGHVGDNNYANRSREMKIDENGCALFQVAFANDYNVYTFYPYSGTTFENDKNGFSLGFKIQSLQKQTAAGAVSMSQVPATSSDFVNLSENGFTPGYNEQYTNPMSLRASIVRFLIYTSDYNDEKVVSVKMESDKALSGSFTAAGTWNPNTIVFDYENATETAETAIVELENLFELTDAKDSNTTKGIYLAVLPSEKADVKFTVITDKANYTFYQAGYEWSFGENQIKNIPLKLTEAVREAVGHTFEWSNQINTSSLNASSLEYDNNFFSQIGFITAIYDGDEIPAGDVKDNISLKFEDENGEPVYWVYEKWVGTNVLQILWNRNTTDKERIAYLYAECKGIRATSCITITQAAASKAVPYIKPEFDNVYEAEINEEGETVTVATLSLTGENGEAMDVQTYIDLVELTCTTIPDTTDGDPVVSVDGDKVTVKFPKNTTATVNTYTLTAQTLDETATAKFTQKAHPDGEVSNKYGYIFDGSWSINRDIDGYGDLDEGWMYIKEMKYPDGTPIPNNVMWGNNGENNELADAILAQAFERGTFADDEYPEYDKTQNFVTIYYKIVDGGEALLIMFKQSANDSGKKRVARINWYNEYGYQFSWTTRQD